ncbi:hypothetical protein D6764_05305 [Candidatus Woesearchaeota archaeon]|nr:MAG: hypothetical protein D6764_05305 [Candidatus Woesearchaeota archaeon]
MTLQDAEDFKGLLNSWLESVSNEMSRDLLEELDRHREKLTDPRLHEDLDEVKRILHAASHAWEHGAYELAGSELERLKERLQ